MKNTTESLGQPVPRDPCTPLLVHVGGGTDASQAALKYDIGTMIWRGRSGADRIGELGADPITGADALLDFATYEYKQFGRDGLVGARVRGARLSVEFTPGYFADHREPAALDQWFSTVSATHESMSATGPHGMLVPVVALTAKWLTEPVLLDRAIRAVGSFDGPVGLVLASRNNPLGTPDPIRGCVELVQSARNVVALRSDEAAIGLLAHGALAASVGSSSTTRHLFYGRPSKMPPRKPGHEVFHWQTMSWIKHYRLDVFAVPTEHLLCHCTICSGRSILRFADPNLAVEALAHSVACLQQYAAEVIGAIDPVDRWIDICLRAADEADRLNRIANQFGLGRSAKAWRAALQPSH